ncbi:cell division control protein 6-like protein [Moniliophthora roreri MCA 2997]|uniref:Cell division control protein 6-like protein n=1 Tax=Moniliophthora roreri (strain MCA 2997) TaxID=1381753 RepID=V2XXN6_MONRO|nr:cell division control protein 6-like protein [Moniliophthora roreri MCA 2997]KAI3618860.1 cell division control protein 6-like protein [Moniliophthora roreri]
MSLAQTPRTTRSTVLGKRSHQSESSASPCEQLQTPDTPTHKRVRTSTVVDGDANKENVPPFNLSTANGETSPVTGRVTRSLRRNATELLVTPTRPRIASMQRASTSNEISPITPATAISHLSLATPPPTPPTLLPIHARVRQLLRPTCNDIISLPGRESERAAIAHFISTFLDGVSEDNFHSLFISGAPGTGKTALIHSVIHDLQDEDRDVKVVNFNCMAINDIEALWDRLLEELAIMQKGKATIKSKKLRGKEAIESILSKLKMKCILVLDELDHIVSTSQALSSLFSLPTTHADVFRVIGIANTHTLTSSSAATPPQVQTIHFAPYTSAQLQQILQSRLAPLQGSDSLPEVVDALKKFLPAPTTTLLSKKVAALTGDVRALLEVLRGAIDLAVASQPKTQDPLTAPAHAVTPTHVLDALKAYKPSSISTPTSPQSSAPTSSTSSPNSEIVLKVRALGIQPRLALLALILASKRIEAGLTLGSSIPPPPIKRSASSSNSSIAGKDITFDTAQLHSYYSSILLRNDDMICSPVSRTEFSDLIGMLEAIGLLNVGSSTVASPTKVGKKSFGRNQSFGNISKVAKPGDVKLASGVWADEIVRGLGIGASMTPADLKEEEILAIWFRESTKLSKDLKALQQKMRKEECGVGFDDAVED